jgi:hypothetical protein
MLNQTAETVALPTVFARAPRPAMATLHGHVGVWDIYTQRIDGEAMILARSSVSKIDRPMAFCHARVFAGRADGSEFWRDVLALVDVDIRQSSIMRNVRRANISRVKAKVKARRKLANTRNAVEVPADAPADMVLVREHLRRKPRR